MDTYKKITIESNRKNFEKIYNFLYACNINSILEEEDRLIFYTQKNFESSFKKIIPSLKKRFSDISIRIENFKNTDWDKKWKSTIEPIYIKNKIVIYPSWRKKNLKHKKNLIKIEIDPKMSFGTGHNETTQLVLEMMLDYISPNDRYLLDFGTGTGILSITAAKIGVNEIIAIDNDIEAIKNAIENINRNKVSKSITLLLNSIDILRFSGFDVIVANINCETIKKYFKHIYSKLKSNGKLILSGIIENEKDSFSSFLKKKGMLIKEIREKNKWFGFFCLKKEIKNGK